MGFTSCILIIDDEPTLGRALARVIRNHVSVALTDARVALALIADGARYGAILCDMCMPSMSGEDFYLALAESQPELAERIIFMSGDVGRSGFLLTIPNLCLEKPFTPDELRSAIATMLVDDPTRLSA